jgi:hypothetical protein
MKLIKDIKSTGRKIASRGEIFRDGYLGKECYVSAIAFLKIRLNLNEGGSGQGVVS